MSTFDCLVGDSNVVRNFIETSFPRFVRRVLKGRGLPRVVLCVVALGGLLLVGVSCDLRTVSSSLENLDESAYRIVTTGKTGSLYLRMPWPENESEQALPEADDAETPPGQNDGIWHEQVTVLGSSFWGASQEYWYSWFLLHLFAIDRDFMPDPNSMRDQGAESLFVVATRDPSTGAYDRFTHYYPPADAERIGSALSGTTTYMRFGYFIRALPSDTVVVGSVVSGGPADRAGLKRDDRVLDVDGLSVDTVLAHLDNTKPTTHAFRIFRPSVNGVLSKSITTGEVNYPTVWVDSLPGGIGYIRISQFVSDEGVATDDLFRAALSEMDPLRDEIEARGFSICATMGEGPSSLRKVSQALCWALISR